MIKRTVWHEAFDVITDETAYWIGFLFADGSVIRSQGETPRVQLRLSEVDAEHVIKLRSFLRSTHTIALSPPGHFGQYATRASVRLSVTSERLAKRLLDLGRYDGPIAHELTVSPHFWRGIVDGDGTIFQSKAGYAVFSVVGSRRNMDALLDFLGSRNLARRMTVRPAKSIYTVGTAGHLAGRIIEELYVDGATALDRKAASARSIIESVRAARTRAAQEAAELRQLYEEGASLAELGRHYGVSDVTILRRMVRTGIPRRSPWAGKGAAVA